MPRRRILCLTRVHPPIIGGMERLSWEFLQALSRRAEVATFVNRRGKCGLPFFYLRTMARLGKVWRRSEVVHLSDPLLLPLGVWGRRTCGTSPALLMHVHGLDLTYPHPLYQAMLRRWLGEIDLFLAISNHVAQLLQNRFAPRGRIAVLTPALAERRCTPAPPPRLPPLPDGAVRVLFVGRLVPRKGLLWFVQNVLPRLPASFHLLAVGGGPEEKKLARLAASRPRLHLLGKVSESTLQSLYRTAQVLVMPNQPTPHDVEGFGLVALEASICGTPVVASRVDGIPDAVHHGQNGLLVPPAQADQFAAAVREAANFSPARRAAIRRYVRKNFRWEDRITRFLQLVADLTSASAAP